MNDHARNIVKGQLPYFLMDLNLNSARDIVRILNPIPCKLCE